MSERPSPNGGNGADRDANGRFAKGNRGGPGNPHAKRVAELRSALLRAVGPDDVEGIARAMIESAKGGDVSAAREILNRLIGTPVPADTLDRIEALEAAVSERSGGAT